VFVTPRLNQPSVKLFVSSCKCLINNTRLLLYSGNNRDFSLDLTILASSEFSESDPRFCVSDEKALVVITSHKACIGIYTILFPLVLEIDRGIGKSLQIENGCAIENFYRIDQGLIKDWSRYTRFACNVTGNVYLHAFIGLHRFTICHGSCKNSKMHLYVADNFKPEVILRNSVIVQCFSGTEPVNTCHLNFCRRTKGLRFHVWRRFFVGPRNLFTIDKRYSYLKTPSVQH